MPEYTPLSDAEIEEAAQKYYFRYARITDRQDTPVLILVGGQPGAGKTAASNRGKNDLSDKGGFVHIDTDQFHDKISSNRGFTFTASQTHEDCKKIAIQVRELAIAGGRNILEEGLFRNSTDLEKRLEQAKETGYRCEIIAIATSREQSRLAVLERREFFRETLGYVRDVPEDKQESAYAGFTQNMLKNASSFDRARVMNRDGETLFDSVGEGKYKSVSEALEEGRKLTDKQVFALTNQWDALKAECLKKGIPSDELARVDQSRKFFDEFKLAQQYNHGQVKLEEYGQVLSRDPRYSQHTGAELAKAAFWRGVSEKGQAFAGKTPDFSAIDSALADRAALARLPNISEIAGIEIERPRSTRERSQDGLELE